MSESEKVPWTTVGGSPCCCFRCEIDEAYVNSTVVIIPITESEMVAYLQGGSLRVQLNASGGNAYSGAATLGPGAGCQFNQSNSSSISHDKTHTIPAFTKMAWVQNGPTGRCYAGFIEIENEDLAASSYGVSITGSSNVGGCPDGKSAGSLVSLDSPFDWRMEISLAVGYRNNEPSLRLAVGFRIIAWTRSYYSGDYGSTNGVAYFGSTSPNGLNQDWTQSPEDITGQITGQINGAEFPLYYYLDVPSFGSSVGSVSSFILTFTPSAP